MARNCKNTFVLNSINSFIYNLFCDAAKKLFYGEADSYGDGWYALLTAMEHCFQKLLVNVNLSFHLPPGQGGREMNLVLAELLARLSPGCLPGAPLPPGAGLGFLDCHPL